MADDGQAVGGVRGPVAAGLAFGQRAVGVGAGEDVVLVGIVAAAVDDVAGLGEGGLLGDLVGRAVELVERRGDQLALGVVPGAFSDAVLRVDAGGAQIGVPGLAGGPGGGGELVAERIGAGEAAEIGAVARPGAGNEEAHLRVGGVGGEAAGRQKRGGGECDPERRHPCLSFGCIVPVVTGTMLTAEGCVQFTRRDHTFVWNDSNSVLRR